MRPGASWEPFDPGSEDLRPCLERAAPAEVDVASVRHVEADDVGDRPPRVPERGGERGDPRDGRGGPGDLERLAVERATGRRS